MLREQIRTTNNETSDIVSRPSRATTGVSINLRQFTITAGGHETRGGSGKAKLKFRPDVSDRKEKTGTIEMTAEIVGETNNRVQACCMYLRPKKFFCSRSHGFF